MSEANSRKKITAVITERGRRIPVKAVILTTGTYLKGMFSEGASVKAGDTVCMIESMKMELEVKAASNGTIHYIATAGSAITAGQPLAEIK